MAPASSGSSRQGAEDHGVAAPAARRRPGTFVRETAYVWVPCLLVILLSAPIAVYMLPSCQDELGENYQPLRALKFFQTKGQAFHKYGVVPNLVLAPGFGATIGFWWLAGSFSDPSSDFPYGFHDPFPQIGFLILQGRLVCLAVNLALLAFFTVKLRAAAGSRWAAFLAVTFCIATSYPAVYAFPNSRPDGLMYTFLAASLGVYLGIVQNGLSPRRAFWLSLVAVLAISSKELAGPAYVLPYLGLGVWGYRQARASGDPAAMLLYRRSVAVALGTGFGAYALLNVVYAPQTWWKRMQHWISGEGADSAIWGGIGFGSDAERYTWLDYARAVGETTLNTLGPAGLIACAAATAAFFWRRPPRWGLIALPLASMFFLGLLPMGYAKDRFYVNAAVCLAPLVAYGLKAIGDAARPRGVARPLAGAAMIAVLVNAWSGAFCWVETESMVATAIERYVMARVPQDERIGMFEMHPRIEGKHRLEYFGWDLDVRSIPDLMASRRDLPVWLFAQRGRRLFADHCAQSPKRAAMLEHETGFDFDAWRAMNGLEGLGYRLVETREPAIPAWYAPFAWLDSVRYFYNKEHLEVWRREAGEERTSRTTGGRE